MWFRFIFSLSHPKNRFVCIVFEMRTFEEVKTNCNFSVQNWCYFIFCLGTEKKLCFISVLVIKYALPLKTFLIFFQSKQSFFIKDYHDLSIFLSKRCTARCVFFNSARYDIFISAKCATFISERCAFLSVKGMIFLSVQGVLLLSVQGVFFLSVQGMIFLSVQGVLLLSVQGVFLSVQVMVFLSVQGVFFLSVQGVLFLWVLTLMGPRGISA